jgi:hypothetical protein
MVGFAADRNWNAASTSVSPRTLEIGRAFAEIIRNVRVARELWVTTDTEEPGAHLWLITDPLDWDEIRELYGEPVDRLYDRIPEGDFFVHVMNPPNHTGDIHDSLRRDAVQLPLRAD